MPPTELRFTYLSKGLYWRFRHPMTGDCKLPHVKRLPIHEQPQQAAFMARYAELLAMAERGIDRAAAEKAEADKAAGGRGSWHWLIKQYKASAEFRALADLTQLDYGKTLVLIDAELGPEPYRLTSRLMVKTVRDDLAKATPRKAHKFKQMVSRLSTWAVENDLAAEGFNPAANIKRIKPKGGAIEYAVWSTQEFDAFMAGAIEPMQTAAMLARYAGERASDIVKLVWTDFQGEIIRVRQSKTGEPLIVACHPSLRAYLGDLKRRLNAQGKRGVAILTSVAGVPYNANSLSSAIGRDVARLAKAGLMPNDRSIHGLRYMAGSEMDEAGCSVSEIEAVLGHRTFKMALKYASQRLRARVAIEKLQAADQ